MCALIFLGCNQVSSACLRPNVAAIAYYDNAICVSPCSSKGNSLFTGFFCSRNCIVNQIAQNSDQVDIFDFVQITKLYIILEMYITHGAI